MRGSPFEQMRQLLQCTWLLLGLGCNGFFTHNVCSWRQMVVMARMVCRDMMLKRLCVQLALALSFRHLAMELFRNRWISNRMFRCLLEDGRDFCCYRFFWRMCFQIRASVMIGRNMGFQR